MNIFKYLFLGAVQGIFEWVPVSSEGVVSLASELLKIKGQPVNLALFLHLGTLLATLIYFRKDLIRVLALKNRELLFFLLVSTPLSLGAGFFLYPLAVRAGSGRWLLLLTGVGLLLTAFFNKKEVKLKTGKWLTPLFTGLLQGMAVVPGVSRSGATLFGLSLADFKAEKALRYSYLMSIPVIIASNAYIFIKDPALPKEAFPALFSSFVIGFLALKGLLTWSRKVDFYKVAFVFSLFCFLGFFVLSL